MVHFGFGNANHEETEDQKLSLLLSMLEKGAAGLWLYWGSWFVTKFVGNREFNRPTRFNGFSFSLVMVFLPG